MASGNHVYTLVGFSEEVDRRPLVFVEALPMTKLCSACGIVTKVLGLLPCEHFFCKQCFDQCERSGQITCPLDGDACSDEEVAWINHPARSILAKQAAMSAVDPARERRKFVNPKIPLGSTWGPRGDGPLCGPASINGANDPRVAVDAKYLSDVDMRDIVRRAQAFLQHHGPCRDDDLWGLVDPWQARLVRSSFGSLATYLSKQPGFHCQDMGEHALLSYWDPEKEGGHSSHYHPLSSGHPGGSFSKEGLANGGVAMGRRRRRGSPSGSSSAGSYKSALEDLDGEEEDEEERAEQKKPRRQRPPLGTTSTCHNTKGVQAVPSVCDSEAQTGGPDNTPEEMLDEEQRRGSEEASRIAAKQASLDKARGRDMGLALDELHHELEEILSKLEEMQCRYRRVMPPTPPPSGGQPSEEEEERNGGVSMEGDNQSGFSVSGQGDGGGGDGGGGASAGSMEEEGAKEAVLPTTVEDGEVGVAESAAAEEPLLPRRRPLCCCPQCRSLARARSGASDADPPKQMPKPVQVYQPTPETASTIWDLESMASSRGPSVGSVPQSKSEAQIVKIVKFVQKRMPQFTEAEIRRHVDEVRILHGGFSRMFIRNIVGLIMEHMSNIANARGNEET